MVSDRERVLESLRFLRHCAEATPLRAHADLFAAERADGHPELRDCLLEALERFAGDLARFRLELQAPKEIFAALLLRPTLQAAWFYRVSHALFERGVTQVPDVVATVARIVTGVEIYYSARIGPGLKVIHGLGTVIGAACRVGARATLYQGVTLGDKLGRETGPRPLLGDGVIVSAGAQILGGVEIGDECVIGANAVVLQSLPRRCIAGGVPARVLVSDLSDADYQAYWTSLKG
jgi:serine O-acetyltransferase